MVIFCIVLVFCDVLSVVGLIIGILLTIWKKKKCFVIPLIVFIICLLLTVVFRNQTVNTYHAIFDPVGPIPEKFLL